MQCNIIATKTGALGRPFLLQCRNSAIFHAECRNTARQITGSGPARNWPGLSQQVIHYSIAELSLKPQLNVVAGASGRDGRRQATPPQAHAGKKERQSRTPDQACQRPRSAVTQRVNRLEGAKACIQAAGQGWTSGQLRFQGLLKGPISDPIRTTRQKPARNLADRCSSSRHQASCLRLCSARRRHRQKRSRLAG